MLCSNCLKKIPEGQEVQRVSGLYWRAGWTGGGGGSEVVCKRCAIKTRKRERKFFIVFISLFLLAFITPFAVIIIKNTA